MLGAIFFGMTPLISYVTELGLFLSENRCTFLEAELLRLMPSFLSEITPLVSYVNSEAFYGSYSEKNK